MTRLIFQAIIKIDWGCNMQRRRCVICGYIALEEGYSSNPYMCSDCEEMMIDKEATYILLDDV